MPKFESTFALYCSELYNQSDICFLRPIPSELLPEEEYLAEGIESTRRSPPIFVVQTSEVADRMDTEEIRKEKPVEALDSYPLPPNLQSASTPEPQSTAPSTPSSNLNAAAFNLHISPSRNLYDPSIIGAISRNPSPRFGQQASQGLYPTSYFRELFPPAFTLSSLLDDENTKRTRSQSQDPQPSGFVESFHADFVRPGRDTSRNTPTFDLELDPVALKLAGPSLLPFNKAELDHFTDEQLGSAVRLALKGGPLFFNPSLDALIPPSPLSTSHLHLSAPSPSTSATSNNLFSSREIMPPEDDATMISNFLTNFPDGPHFVSADVIPSPFRYDAEQDTSLSLFYCGTPAVVPIKEHEAGHHQMNSVQVEAMILEEMKRIESEAIVPSWNTWGMSGDQEVETVRDYSQLTCI